MKTRPLTLVTMNVYWFGLAFMWNALHPIVLPAVLLRFVPEGLKNTYLGAMTFAGLILALIVQPVAGGLSDRTRSRWGRRRPWMVAGTVASLACLAVMTPSQALWQVALGYILLQVASNTAHGPAQGLIPDLVEAGQRGVASGVKNLFDMGGLIVASLVAGQLMSDDNPAAIFGIIAALLVVGATLTIGLTRESASDGALAPVTNPISPRADLAAHPIYARFLVGRWLVMLGTYVVQSFAFYYLRDWLGVPDAAAVTGNLMAAIGVALTLLVFPAGWLSDRIGRWTLNFLAAGVAAAGILLLVFVRTVPAVYAMGAIIGMATGVFLSTNWALATDLIPPAEAGKYLGYTNFATAGAGALSRLGGPMIDGVNALFPGTAIGYPVTFALASLLTLSGAVLLARLGRRVGAQQGDGL